MSQYQKEMQVAVDAVIKACILCKDVQSSLIAGDTISKDDGSPVTIADFGAQAVVCDHLSKNFPGDSIIGEENADELRKPESRKIKDKVVEYCTRIEPTFNESRVLNGIDKGIFSGSSDGRLWTLDPIDGTKGFLRGEQYAVALALMEGGKVVMGVLGCPNLPVEYNRPDGERGCIFAAEKDGGAYVRTFDNPSLTNIYVNNISEPKRAAFCESVESGHSSHSQSAEIALILGVTVPPVRIDSQCKYAAVAKGDASIYLRLPTRKDYEEKIWDHAAGSIIIEEAGGEVSDIYGEPLDFSQGKTLKNNTGVIVSNGKFHHIILAAVEAVVGSR